MAKTQLLMSVSQRTSASPFDGFYETLGRSFALPCNIECRTVHRFQGGERDMMILDTVDTEPMAPGVLLAGNSPQSKSKNLINVSISRARGKLFIIADVSFFQNRSPTAFMNVVLAKGIKMGMRVEIGKRFINA